MQQSAQLSIGEQTSALTASSTPRPTKRKKIEASEPDEEKTSKSTLASERKLQRRKQSAVRFASVPQTHVTPRWSDTETTSSWFSKYDIAAFKRQEYADAESLRTLIHTSPSIDYLPREPGLYRGLERLLSAQIICDISNRRKRCATSVLAAQREGLGLEQIAQASKKCTEMAASWAVTLGRL